MKAIQLVAAALITVGTLASACALADFPGIKRTLLQQHDLDIPGYEVIQNRADLGPGITAPWHRHPGAEIVYVLEGTLQYQLEGQAPVILKAGEVLFVPAGVYHITKNIGDGNAAALGTYVVPNGRPLTELKP
jgi:quercetin dioxygenase-like cupin family protein